MRLILALLIALCLSGCVSGAVQPAASDKRIAFTFDDVPRRPGAFLNEDERTRRLVAALQSGGISQAAFFLNPGHIEDRDGAEARIAAYVAAGHVIANHSHRHRSLSDLTADEFLADIDTAERWLAGRDGYRPWFRFPFLNEGRRDKARRDAVRAGLAARRLTNGYVTAESSDWLIEALTIEAAKNGDAIDQAALRDLYVESHVEAAEFYRQLGIEALGRAPAQVLLLHETDLAALYVAELAAALRARGWTIITADEAYRDPVAQLQPDVPSAQGTLTEALAWERGVPAPRWYERNEEGVMREAFARRVLHREQDSAPSR